MLLLWRREYCARARAQKRKRDKEQYPASPETQFGLQLRFGRQTPHLATAFPNRWSSAGTACAAATCTPCIACPSHPGQYHGAYLPSSLLCDAPKQR